MNITLIYNDSKFNVDILNDTPCQYLYNIANKIFRLPLSQFRLTYKDREIENNSRLIFSVLGQIDPDSYSESPIINVESVPPTNIQTTTQLPVINNQVESVAKFSTKKISGKKMGVKCYVKYAIIKIRYIIAVYAIYSYVLNVT